MQRGKQRAGLHLKGAIGHLRDTMRNGEPVHRGKRQRFKNQQIESSLQQIGGGHARIEILYELI